MPRPDPPANVAVTKGDTGITITWDAVVGATAYTVLRSPTLDDEGYVIGITDQLIWTDTLADINRGYWYSVRVSAGGACSVASTPDSGYSLPVQPDAPAMPTGVMVAEIP